MSPMSGRKWLGPIVLLLSLSAGIAAGDVILPSASPASTLYSLFLANLSYMGANVLEVYRTDRSMWHEVDPYMNRKGFFTTAVTSVIEETGVFAGFVLTGKDAKAGNRKQLAEAAVAGEANERGVRRRLEVDVVDAYGRVYDARENVIFAKLRGPSESRRDARETAAKATERVVDVELVNGEVRGVAFAENDRLREIVLPPGTTAIGPYAFRDCAGLVSVDIPDTVTDIGEGAFKGCGSLRSIAIPSSVKRIQARAFAGSGLKSIVIPDSVESIGRGAFQFCRDLESVYLPNSIAKIEDDLFSGCANLREVNIPVSVISVGRDSFAYCTRLRTVVVPASVLSLDKGAFRSAGERKALLFENAGALSRDVSDFTRGRRGIEAYYVP